MVEYKRDTHVMKASVLETAYSVESFALVDTDGIGPICDVGL